MHTRSHALARIRTCPYKGIHRNIHLISSVPKWCKITIRDFPFRCHLIRKVQRNKIKVLNFQNGFKCFCWFEWIVRCRISTKRTHTRTHTHIRKHKSTRHTPNNTAFPLSTLAAALSALPSSSSSSSDSTRNLSIPNAFRSFQIINDAHTVNVNV